MKEARTGQLTWDPVKQKDVTHLQKTSQMRSELIKLYQNGGLTDFEQRYVFELYTEATQALKFALSGQSKFPFNSVNNQSLMTVLNLVKKFPY